MVLLRILVRKKIAKHGFLKKMVFFFSEPFYGHLHGNKQTEIADLKVLAQIKDHCAKPMGSQLNFNKHRRNLLQIRNTNIPKPPNNVHEVIEAYKNDVVVEHYSRTLHENSNDQFYKGSYECDDFSYSYFASDHVMNNIRDNIPEEKREFLMDATFKICPLGFARFCGTAPQTRFNNATIRFMPKIQDLDYLLLMDP